MVEGPGSVTGPSRPEEREHRFRRLYDAHHGDIDGYCRRRAPDAIAADAVSETFLTAWRRLDDVPSGESGRLWLFGVARNVLANQQRGATRRRRLHLRLLQQRHVDDRPESAVVETEPVLRALSRLRPDDAELLRLVAWEELSHAEIAELMQISPNAVGIRVHRARARLRSALSEDFSKPPKGSTPSGHVPLSNPMSTTPMSTKPMSTNDEERA